MRTSLDTNPVPFRSSVAVYFAYPEGVLAFDFCRELETHFSAKTLTAPYPGFIPEFPAICFFVAIVNPRLGHNALRKDAVLLNGLFHGEVFLCFVCSL